MIDSGTIKTLVDGLRFAKETFQQISQAEGKIEAARRIQESLDKLGDAQDKLFDLRDELFSLQTENKRLDDIIKTYGSWEERIGTYVLVTTPGGAVVYQYRGEPEHYVCPNCINRKEIQILQDRHAASGDFECPG